LATRHVTANRQVYFPVEDNVGLKVVGQLNLDVQQGKEAYALLKQGALDGMSIGYLPVQFSRDEKNKDLWQSHRSKAVRSFIGDFSCK